VDGVRAWRGTKGIYRWEEWEGVREALFNVAIGLSGYTVPMDRLDYVVNEDKIDLSWLCIWMAWG
jgi:hypothetical protein